MRSIVTEQIARLAKQDQAMRRLRDLTLYIAMAWLVLALLYGVTGSALLGFVVTLGMYVCLVAIGLFTILSVLIVGVEVRLARKIVRGKHEEAVGLLLQVLDADDSRTRRAASRALVRALPRVGSLSEWNLEEIHGSLLGGETHGDSDLMVAFLNAMGRFGDAGSLEAARRIAALRPTTRPEKRVHRAALECIAAIRRRIDASTGGKPLSTTKAAHPRAA